MGGRERGGGSRAKPGNQLVLYIVAIDWIMKRPQKNQKKWNPVDPLKPARRFGFCR